MAATDAPMTTDRMRWCLDQIGWPQRELARRLHANESTVRAMARGMRDIPPELAEWLEELATFHHRIGTPKGWRNTALAEEAVQEH